jgi:hypothetical protein
MFLSLVVAGLAMLAGLRFLKLRADRANGSTRLTDDLIRRIEEEGSLELEEDEPLDLAQIDEEEARFWEEERWDEADPI